MISEGVVENFIIGIDEIITLHNLTWTVTLSLRQGYTSPWLQGAEGTKFLWRWVIIFYVPPYGTCFLSDIWILESWGCSYINDECMHPCSKCKFCFRCDLLKENKPYKALIGVIFLIGSSHRDSYLKGFKKSRYRHILLKHHISTTV
jgi:hypothetical protein